MSFHTSGSPRKSSQSVHLQPEGAEKGLDDLGETGTQSTNNKNASTHSQNESGRPSEASNGRQFVDENSGNSFSGPRPLNQPQETCPTSSTESLEELMAQGRSFFLQFQDSGIISEIDKAIEYWTRALSLAPDGEIDKLRCMTNLGCSYESRFHHVGKLSELDKSIDYLAQAASLIPQGHVFEPAILNNLGSSYLSRFEHVGKLEDADEAIRCLDKAVSLTADGQAGKPARLNSLGAAYHRRYEHSGELEDINTAVDCQVKAVGSTPDGDAGMPGYLNNLGNSYISRFEYLGRQSDLEEAIGCQTKAVSLTIDGHACKPKRLNNLGISLSYRFEYLGNISDINEAIDYQVKAVSLTPPKHLDMPGWLSNLGNSYGSRFERLGELPDLDAAITHLVKAVSLIDDSHPDMPLYRNNLGNSYITRFMRIGELSDLNLAIVCLAEAASSIPETNANQPEVLNSLGNAYQYRFQHLGELPDLNKAIKYFEQAISLTPACRASKQAYLVNLENSYLCRFGRQGKYSDISKAIECRKSVASFAPDLYTQKRIMLKSFANRYIAQSTGLGELSDLDEMIDGLDRVVSSIPDSHLTKPQTLNTLGLCCRYRFDRLGEQSDLNKAINYLEHAVSLTPDGHPKHPRLLNNLGDTYLQRFEHQSMPEDINAAIMYFSKSAQSMTGSARFRFQASRKWARLSSQYGVSSRKIAYERTMELLPQLVWLGTTIDRRYQLLAEIGDVATEAASCAIELGDYNRAVEWLESGRSIVWNQMLQLRTPFDDLSAKDPELAQKLRKVGQGLEYEGARSSAPFLPEYRQSDLEEKVLPTTDMSELKEESTRFQNLALEWERLLQQAREIPGFEHFMRPPRASELMRATEHGPVAMINVHGSRCDALILLPHSNNIAHVPLKSFSLKKAVDVQEHMTQAFENQLRCFKKANRLGHPNLQDNRTPEQLLGTIWCDVVKPVLDCLGYTIKLPVDELPHLTWCTTGPLSFFPLHAAGYYDSPQPNAFDLVISSYTPTLSALLNLTAQGPFPCSGILAVGQEHTRGLPSLPYTRLELSIIKEKARATRYLQLDDHHATVDAVLNAMDEYSWVHLACHAIQRTADPAQSAFQLHDGDLTLSTLTKRPFKNKGLAFLSACQTARGDERLPDEAVHLAAGMLMAGYASVIATMWPISDEDGPEVAKHVYAAVLSDGNMDSTRAAKALHKAVVALREKVGTRAFGRWAPFIHMGL